MRALFQDWNPTLIRFHDHVISSLIQKWKLLHHLELETWRNQEGNFVLLGNSCHPMLLYLAQGAASVIQDGAVLGVVLGKVELRSQIPKATEIWQGLRKQRSQFLVKEWYAQVRYFLWNHSRFCELPLISAQRDAFHMPDGPG